MMELGLGEVNEGGGCFGWRLSWMEVGEEGEYLE